jgi:hypothetical protein
LTHFFVAELTRDDATLAKLEYVDFVEIFAVRAVSELFFVIFLVAITNYLVIALNAFVSYYPLFAGYVMHDRAIYAIS